MKFLHGVLFLFLFLFLPICTQAAELQWETSNTLTDPPKYGDHFTHYDYVNPDAPKGGTLNRVASGNFDTFNPYIVGGVPAAGLAPFGGGLLYDTLMDQSIDQGGVAYAALAEATMAPPDQAWVKFRLNPKARWHDGVPISVDDVIWSFEKLRTISPYYSSYYKDVEKAEITGKREVTFFFKEKGNRELPKILGDLVVLPKHWWEGTDKAGNKRDITKPIREVPLGSGLYKIESFEPGKVIVWRRVSDAWGVDLPQNIGRYNFDRIRFTYLTDANSVWEAFKKGGMNDFRLENNIQNWMQNYTFPAFLRGDVKKISLSEREAGTYQAYYFNTRLEKFSDIRVRKALAMALDFETMNRVLYFGQYHRLQSYYGNQIVSARGLPEGRELQILQTVKDDVPPEVFTKEFKLPVYNTPQATREHLSEAMKLLQEAGWHLQDNRLVNEKGDVFSIEFLFASPMQQRPTSLYIANLRRLGIDATMRIVDQAQYENRTGNFDFDVVMQIDAQSNSPGNEQISFFGSSSANSFGSRNYAGIRNRAIDKLIAGLIQAKTRDDIIAYSRAIDRVLQWNYYSVPNWAGNTINIAYWAKIALPEKQPTYAGFDWLSWWIKPQN